MYGVLKVLQRRGQSFVMEPTSAKRQKAEEIGEAKYSLSSLLSNGRNFSVLMSAIDSGEPLYYDAINYKKEETTA